MTSEAGEMEVGERLAAVLDELGIERAHIGVGRSNEDQVAALLRVRPSAGASISFVLAPLRAATELQPYADRILGIFGEPMVPAQRHARTDLESWPGVTLLDLPDDYEAVVWADVVRDHTEHIVEAVRTHAQRSASLDAAELPAGEGWVAGVHYRVEGSGPPLFLFPLGLAPSQWDAAIDALNREFTTIRLGGPHLGHVKFLEERSSGPLALLGVRSMFELLALKPGMRVLEVGTGTGVLARALVEHTNREVEVVATDISAYLLREAQDLAEATLPDAPLVFEDGDAIDLPFEDGSFDAVFAVTVLEECDADRAIAEMARVLKPGGRAGVIVRSRDLPWAWHLDVPDAITAKLNEPTGAVSEGGCADESLYERMAACFREVVPSPFLMTWWPPVDPPVSNGRGKLTPAEAEIFDAALGRGIEGGTAFVALPRHCAVGIKA